MKLFVFLLSIFWTSTLLGQNTVGIIKNTDKALDGYTLLAPSGSTYTYLINNCGEVVNQWESNYRPGTVAYLLEDGSLLRTAILNNPVINSGGSGGRLERYSWEGELIWEYDYNNDLVRQHHDIEYMPNGHILILAWEKKTMQEAIDKGRLENLLTSQGLLSEHIIEIKPVGINTGQIVWEWHLWDHLIQDVNINSSNYAIVSEQIDKLNINDLISDTNPTSPDFIHFNSIDYNPDLDQIMISSRVKSEIYIIDHSTTTLEAASSHGGKYQKGGGFLYRYGNPQVYNHGIVDDRTLFGQHDPHWIPPGLPHEGKIMIFNNGVGRPGGDFSSIDIIEPSINTDGSYYTEENGAYGPSELFYTYNRFMSIKERRISGSQMLDNGNILICQGTSGRFLEINSTENVVWEYVNPDKGGNPVPQGTQIVANDVFRAYKYTPDYQAFDNRDLTPTTPIELDFTDNCTLYPITSGNENILSNNYNLILTPNPVEDLLTIEGLPHNSHIAIHNLNGQKQIELNMINNYIKIDTHDLLPGIYVVVITHTDNNVTIHKIGKM